MCFWTYINYGTKQFTDSAGTFCREAVKTVKCKQPIAQNSVAFLRENVYISCTQEYMSILKRLFNIIIFQFIPFVHFY